MWTIRYRLTAKTPEVTAPIGEHSTSDGAWRAFTAWRIAAGIDYQQATAEHTDLSAEVA